MSNDIKVSSHTNSTFKANWPEKVAGVIYVYFDLLSSPLACFFPLPNQRVCIYIYKLYVYIYIHIIYIYTHHGIGRLRDSLYVTPTCPRTELVLRRWLSDFGFDGLGCVVGSVAGDMPELGLQLVGRVF